MRLLIACAFAAASWAEENGTLVKVAEIPADVVAKIREAETEVQNAAHFLRRAQKVTLDAQAKKADAIKLAARDHQAYEGECKQDGTGWRAFRPFRRVAVNGKYVLVTEGVEACGSLASWTTDAGTMIGVIK